MVLEHEDLWARAKITASFRRLSPPSAALLLLAIAGLWARRRALPPPPIPRRNAAFIFSRTLTHRIIGAAIDVHKALGPGYLESVYENALAIELRSQAVPFRRQESVPVSYRSKEVGVHRLDFFVANAIVVELKAVKSIEDVHFAVVRSYLRAMGCRNGLLLNFAKPTLEVKRVIAPEWPAGALGEK